MSKSRSLADGAAGPAGRGEREVARTVVGQAAAWADAGTEHAPTPFYDNLMSMIEATAEERWRVAQNDEVEDPASRRRWGAYVLGTCAIGLVVAAAVGRALLVPEASQMQPPPVVTADAGRPGDERFKPGGAATNDGTEDRAPAAEPPDGPGPAASDEPRTADSGIGASAAEAARPEARPAVAPVAAGGPVDSPAPEAESGSEPPADAPAGGKSDHTDPADVAAASPGAQSPPVDTPFPPLPEFQTASVERADEHPATSAARMLSDANMRAGPGNGHAVLATIARGRTVEVIGCRAWCEVIYAGRRGWVYKGFIDAPPSPAGR